MGFKPVRWPVYVDPTCWVELSLAMQKESTIMSSRTTPENLQRQYENGLAAIILKEGAIVGFICAWPVAESFYEIGSGWVHPTLRGSGLGRTLYLAMRDLEMLTFAIGFAITQNPIALKAGQHARLLPHDDWDSPVPWGLTCAPCSLVEDDKKKMCPRRNKTCWLRVMR